MNIFVVSLRNVILGSVLSRTNNRSWVFTVYFCTVEPDSTRTIRELLFVSCFALPTPAHRMWSWLTTIRPEQKQKCGVVNCLPLLQGSCAIRKKVSICYSLLLENMLQVRTTCGNLYCSLKWDGFKSHTNQEPLKPLNKNISCGKEHNTLQKYFRTRMLPKHVSAGP